METFLSHLVIHKPEYEYFMKLKSNERLLYFFSLYEFPENDVELDLSSFFDTVSDTDYMDNALMPSETPMPILDLNNPNHVAVMFDDDLMLVESNSLRSIRMVIKKFAESGYILQRDHDTERMFLRDKQTKYMRCFHVINQIYAICYN
jgi:hypothetical protein